MFITIVTEMPTSEARREGRGRERPLAMAGQQVSWVLTPAHPMGGRTGRAPDS